MIWTLKKIYQAKIVLVGAWSSGAKPTSPPQPLTGKNGGENNQEYFGMRLLIFVDFKYLINCCKQYNNTTVTSLNIWKDIVNI